MHTGQTPSPLSSCTSGSNPKSKSNAFVALPFCPSWSHRISRGTQVRHKLLCSGTSSSGPTSESKAFVALQVCSSWSHRISQCTQARPKLICVQAPQALVRSQRSVNLSPCHFARYGFTGSVETHRPDPSSGVFRHLKLYSGVREQFISLLENLLVMVPQNRSMHTGQTPAPLSSCTSSSSPKSESNAFVTLPFCSSWYHRISCSFVFRHLKL